MTMYEETQALIRESNIPLSVISQDNGISVRWLYKYLNNEFKDVGAKRLESLRKYLIEAQKAA